MLRRYTLEAKLAEYFFAAALLIIFVALLWRNGGLYPTVFSDEYTYSLFSRLIPISEATVPDYLYLGAYRFTTNCGNGYLDCARILNALFFVASAPFIYLTARRVCSKTIASFIAVLALTGPINTYTAYYMPEAMYFLSFWVFTWFILGLGRTSALSSWCLGGVLLGLAALVKPHALFILPAIVIYILYVTDIHRSRAILFALLTVGAFAAGVLLTKTIIGLLLAGKPGLTMFGSTYGSIAVSAVSNFQRYAEFLTSSGESVIGHLTAICLMFGLVMSVAIYSVANSIARATALDADRKLTIYTFTVVASLVIVVGLFTASIANAGPYESISRLHMRYYDFAFPLFLMVAASHLSSTPADRNSRWRAAVALPIGAAMGYAIYTRLAPFSPSYIDSPELRGFTRDTATFFVLGAMSLSCLVLWVAAAQIGTKAFLFVFMPLAVGVSTFGVSQDLRQRLVPDVYDEAGIIAKNYLSSDDLAKVVIVGSDTAALHRSLFYLDNPQASSKAIPREATFDLSELPPDKEWALVIGNQLAVGGGQFRLPMNGFILARNAKAIIVDFKKSVWPGVVSNARGLSWAGRWGTWSEGSATTLEFAVPLPEKFAVHLVAHAFGPNVGKEFVAHVGDSVAKFTLGASPEERVFEFSNPTRSQTIEIDIPAPTSPRALGMNDDARILGIEFFELRIAPEADAAAHSSAPTPTPPYGADPNFVDFKQSAWPGVVSSARGLSSAEPWGTWSEGSATALEFAAPLPEKFAVHLVAQAFGPNVAKEFVARVGDSLAKFTLGATPKERVLQFSNPTRSRTIEIDIPTPTSPKALGLSGDDRNLGIGLVELRIAPQ